MRSVRLIESCESENVPAKVGILRLRATPPCSMHLIERAGHGAKQTGRRREESPGKALPPEFRLSVDGGVEFGDLNPRYGVLGGGGPYPSCSLDLANQENPCVGEQIAQDDRRSFGGPIQH